MSQTLMQQEARSKGQGARGKHSASCILPPASSLLYILIGLAAAALLWGPGMVNTRGGGDSPFLLQRTLDMAETFRHGIFPPRWMAHAAYDLGYPFFSHYAALPYYLSGALAALGFSPLVAIQATQTLGFILAALSMALWASRIYTRRAAVLVAVIAYTFAPFHLVNVYVRGDSLSEFYAFIWYPLVLWTLDRVVARATRGRITAAALAYGALILTHNVSAMIFSPFALLYAVIQITNSELRIANQRSDASATSTTYSPHPALRFTFYVLRALLPFVLAFLLTAWFWVPAIVETGYGQMGDEFTAGYFHYTNHFRGINLVQPTLAFNYSIALRTEDAGPFTMGLVQAGLAGMGVVVLIWKVFSLRFQAASPKSSGESEERASPPPPPNHRHHASRITHHVSRFYLLFGLALATLMITPLSKPLWDHLPLLEITQFPWRFLSVQALFTAIVTAGILEALPTSRGVRESVHNVLALTAVSVLLIISVLWGLHPERLRIDDADVTWDTLLRYEAFTGNIGTTIRHEYLPRDVVPRLYTSESVVAGTLRPIADGDSLQTWELLDRTPIEQTWRVSLGADGGSVAFPLNWWPGWHATIDGRPAAAYPLTGSGRLAVDLPSGDHTVTLRLRNTPLRTVSEIISTASCLGVVVWLFFSRKSKVENPKSKIQNGILCAVCIFTIATALPAIFHRAPSAAATFFDFAQMPYPHAGPIDFGVAQLRSVMLSAHTVRPGDTLTVTQTWHISTTGPLTGTLRLVSPAEPRHNVPYALAEATFTLACPGTCETTLTIPEDIARGFYLVELCVYGVNGELLARTPGGSGMGTLYVGTIDVPHGPALDAGAPVLAGFRDITLHAVEPIQPDPATLRLKMAWSTPGTPRNWSLSLRLLDATGRLIVQRDLQPGYGYLPTTLWLPGEMVVDYPVLPLPDGLAPGDYTLQVITYLLATMDGGGTVDVPITLTAATRYDLRDACCEQTRKGATILCQAGGVALLGTDLPETLVEGSALDFYAEWNALEAPAADLRARWALVDAAGALAGSFEGPVAPGSRTSAWARHTWVRAPVHIDLPPVLSPGDYDVAVTLLDETGDLATCAFPARIAVQPRPRAFAVPDLAHPQDAAFGDEIRLLGYELAQDADALSLTLWWQAQTAPSRDYKRFVHLYDPATEAIVAQDDAMPRAWTYPTTWWAAGEIVSETITLDVSAAAAGDYRLGVGWYDPETVTRLPASDAAGQPQPAGRVTLNLPVTLKH